MFEDSSFLNFHNDFPRNRCPDRFDNPLLVNLVVWIISGLAIIVTLASTIAPSMRAIQPLCLLPAVLAGPFCAYVFSDVCLSRMVWCEWDISERQKKAHFIRVYYLCNTLWWLMAAIAATFTVLAFINHAGLVVKIGLMVCTAIHTMNAIFTATIYFPFFENDLTLLIRNLKVKPDGWEEAERDTRGHIRKAILKTCIAIEIACWLTAAITAPDCKPILGTSVGGTIFLLPLAPPLLIIPGFLLFWLGRLLGLFKWYNVFTRNATWKTRVSACRITLILALAIPSYYAIPSYTAYIDVAHEVATAWGIFLFGSIIGFIGSFFDSDNRKDVEFF